MNKLFYKNKKPIEIAYYESFDKLNSLKNDNNEKYFNIVIVTEGNSKKFKKCYESIIKQSYFKMNIYILFRDEYQLSYIITSTERSNHHLIPMFKHNDYIQYLTNYVKNNFHTIIIKESQMFVNRNCLKYINNETNDLNVLYWNNVDIDNDKIEKGYCYKNYLKKKLPLIDSNKTEELSKYNIKIEKQNIIIMKNI